MPLSGHLRELRKKIGNDLLVLPSAAVAIYDEQGRVLMGLHSDRKVWVMPGGLIEPEEIPADAAIREVWEETGLTVEIEKLVLNKTFPPDRFGMYYLCRITNGVFEPSDEVAEYGYFSLNNLPDVRPRDYALINEIYEQMGFIEHELA